MPLKLYKTTLLSVIFFCIIIFSDLSLKKSDFTGSGLFSAFSTGAVYAINITDTTTIRDITLNIIFNEFKDNGDTDIRLYSMISAAAYGESSEPFFEYITASASPYFQARALKLIRENNFNFDKAIMNCLFSDNSQTLTNMIECWPLLKSDNRLKIADRIFFLGKKEYLILALPMFFSEPEKFTSFIRKILSHQDNDVRFEAYKNLTKVAPDLIEFACLGLFDEDITINRFILSKHALYKENGKRLIIYGLNSKKSLVKEYANYLFTNYYSRE